MARVRIGRTFVDAMDFPLRRFRAVLQRTAIPVLLSLGIQLVAVWVQFANLSGSRTVQEANLAFGSTLVSFVGLAYFLLLLVAVVPIVALLRSEIQGEPANLGWLHFRISRLELQALLGQVICFAPPIVFFLALFALMGFEGHFKIDFPWSIPVLVGFLGCLVVSGRLVVLIPMAAFEEWPSPRVAWAMTRGNTLAIFVAALVLTISVLLTTALVVGGASFIAMAILSDAPDALKQLASLLFGSLVEILNYGFCAGFLISVWRQLNEVKDWEASSGMAKGWE